MTSTSGVPRYALDLHSAVSHVAASLDRVSPGTLSRRDLADTYQHPNPGDLARIRQHEGVTSDRAATAWLIDKAISELGRQVVVRPDGTLALARGLKLADLRYKDRPVYAVVNDHVRFGDPFNPMTTSARFARGTRLGRSRDDLEELRESMATLGWVPEFPALKDRRGVVLVGHRRLAVAAELNIEPVVQILTDLGSGDEADAQRLRIVLASNLGAKSLTPMDRQAIAQSLHLDGWTMTAIGRALGVSRSTVRRDLVAVPAPPPPEPPVRRKVGRPKGVSISPLGSLKSEDPHLQAEIERRLLSGDGVMMREDLAATFDLNVSTVREAIAFARGRLFARQAAEEADVPA